MKLERTRLLCLEISYNMRILILMITGMFCVFTGHAQKSNVSFLASDGLEVTADLYVGNPVSHYIILFHQAGSSRGEFQDIAPRFQKMGYNVLAVDLRSGSNMNYVNNQTAENAREKNLPNSMFDAHKDISAAIRYVGEQTSIPVVLLGSSYSASLVLEEALANPKVKAVISFSPGEYFDGHSVKESIAGLNKPAFITATVEEEPYVTELVKDLLQYTLFVPQGGAGQHGARALWKENETSSEYWLALIMFIRSVENI